MGLRPIPRAAPRTGWLGCPQYSTLAPAKTRPRLVIIGAATAIATLALNPLPARGEEGFAVNRFEPAERGGRFFVVDSLDMRGRLRPSVGLVGEWARSPLVAYAPGDVERRAIVRDQLLLHLGGSLVVADRWRFGLDLPFAPYQDGEAVDFADQRYRPATKPAFGDLRIAADVRIAGTSGDPLVLAAGMRLWAPTGVASQMTGDGAARLGPQVLAAGDVGPFVWAARLAFVERWRDDVYAGSKLGGELSGGLGAGIRLVDGRLVVGPEVFASTGVHAFFGRRSTPAEVLVGAHYDVGAGVRAGASVGAGIGRGYGAPALRMVASLEWTPPIPPPDRDRDGIFDGADACPDEAGPPSSDPEANGCPEPVPMPMPREDADGDGIFDTEDACPAVGGVHTKDPMTNGCPPQPEKPLAVVTPTEIRIEQQVRFQTDSAELLVGGRGGGENDAVLGEIKRVLDEHPEIRKVRVEGHTDAVGNDAYNEELSARRAASVARWLVEHGVAEGRLVTEGFGSRQPIDSNATEAGRANNRRVVLRIVEREAPTRKK
jgi:OmpA-OmpF porin, OOP family